MDHSQTIDPQSLAVPGPQPTIYEIRRCQLSSWYPVFSNLKVSGKKRTNYTIVSKIIPDLPPTFRDYLQTDGVRLPKGATKLSSCIGSQSDSWSTENESDHEGGDVEYHFPQLNEQIEVAIAALGGAVIPKLNWSSPKDATWVSGGNLKCQTPGDVFLLVKSSDFCSHDVFHAFEGCSDATTEDDSARASSHQTELVLRKWCNLHPSMEFRCFVKDNTLVAVSQRDHTQHYPHLLRDRDKLCDTIDEFFEDVVKDTFGTIGEPEVTNYVLDLYIDKKDRVWIIDFNPWATRTDPLLFEWEELMTMDCDEEVTMKVVEDENKVRQDPLASYRAPIDTIDLVSMTSGDSAAFEKFLQDHTSDNDD